MIEFDSFALSEYFMSANAEILMKLNELVGGSLRNYLLQTRLIRCQLTSFVSNICPLQYKSVNFVSEFCIFYCIIKADLINDMNTNHI